jgi:hypothetical protein
MERQFPDPGLGATEEQEQEDDLFKLTLFDVRI